MLSTKSTYDEWLARVRQQITIAVKQASPPNNLSAAERKVHILNSQEGHLMALHKGLQKASHATGLMVHWKMRQTKHAIFCKVG